MSKKSAVSVSSNKRHFSANGSLLLPLALKWRLVRIMVCPLLVILVLPCIMGNSASASSITLTVPAKLQFSVPADGEFHDSSPGATVSIKSDSPYGYTFSISGGDDYRHAALENKALEDDDS